MTLPKQLLNKVERFAATRHQTVNSAVTYWLEAALRNEPSSRSGGGILELWRAAYLPLSELERLLIDGIILDEPITEGE